MDRVVEFSPLTVFNISLIFEIHPLESLAATVRHGCSALPPTLCDGVPMLRRVDYKYSARCVFVSSILAVVPPIKARRVLHLFIVFYCPTRTNRGHTGGGKHRGFFLPYDVPFSPNRLAAVLALNFVAKRGRPPLSLVNNKLEYCLLTKLFSYKSLSTTRYESETKNLTLAEIRTRDLVARKVTWIATRPPGRPYSTLLYPTQR